MLQVSKSEYLFDSSTVTVTKREVCKLTQCISVMLIVSLYRYNKTMLKIYNIDGSSAAVV